MQYKNFFIVWIDFFQMTAQKVATLMNKSRVYTDANYYGKYYNSFKIHINKVSIFCNAIFTWGFQFQIIRLSPP